MSKQLEVFMPYLDAMIRDNNLDVTEGQMKGVELLIENAVTSDQAGDVERMLHLAPGSAELYTQLLVFITEEGSNNDSVVDSSTDDADKYINMWNAFATILSLSAPDVGAKFSIVPIEEDVE